jgi:3-hydroxy-3-methylglutaryl CoA synthase
MIQDRPQAALLALGTAVPSHRFQQAALGRWMAESLVMQPALSRWIRRLFTLHLSPDIPRRLGGIAPRALAALFADRPTPRFWAIHPGGRALVDRLAELFDLAPEQAEPSLAVLRHYGNMSSPTILFALHELRDRLRCDQTGDTEACVAMAFGPGLVVEMAHLTYVPRLEAALRQTIGAEIEASGAYIA